MIGNKTASHSKDTHTLNQLSGNYQVNQGLELTLLKLWLLDPLGRLQQDHRQEGSEVSYTVSTTQPKVEKSLS